MNKFTIVWCCVFLLLSCAVEYDFEPSDVIEPDRLVVNSILNPLHPIEVSFYTTMKTDSGYIYQPVSNVQVVLKENDCILFDGICDSICLKSDYKPRVNAAYSIEVSLNGYEPVSASTIVPDSIVCEVRGEPTYESIMSLSDFRFPSGDISLWITSYMHYKSGKSKQYAELYASNFLIDKVNRQEGAYMYEGMGSGYHDAFLRIKHTNLPKLDSIRFIPGLLGYDDHDSIGYEEKDFMAIKIITAEKEYDRYNRTFYEQKAMVIYDDDISAILYQPVSVYSNIKNGLGIFAGMSESNYYFKVIEPEF